MSGRKCIFCKIIKGDSPAEIFYKNDDLIIFKDIKPVAKVHLLAVPNDHIPNINYLSKDDKNLVETLFKKGRQILEEKGGKIEDSLVGFHKPPFNTVSHLHLHVIWPKSELTWWHANMFKPNSYWFTTYENFLVSKF